MDNNDNDGDGLIDCKDPECYMNPQVTVCPKENTDATCKDYGDWTTAWQEIKG